MIQLTKRSARRNKASIIATNQKNNRPGAVGYNPVSQCVTLTTLSPDLRHVYKTHIAGQDLVRLKQLMREVEL
jgi:hypothetical protein